ncbi:MAG: arsenate reductase family protein [Lachnospiraceae bacterium]|nr:arsenate reductase family protein [Lachnospiraceae bacterium]
MKALFVEYPKCSTCQRAKKWLIEHQVEFEDRNIKEEHPDSEELRAWHTRSGLDIKRFFNTSGVLYREMELKDRLSNMTLEEKYELLATDGMLVKRPILVTEKGVAAGFKPEEWERLAE